MRSWRRKVPARFWLEKAKEMSRSFRPHVAIVGINLTGDAGDRSGITLLEPLQSARCILYSGNLNVKLVREIQSKYPQVTWVEKVKKSQLCSS